FAHRSRCSQSLRIDGIEVICYGSRDDEAEEDFSTFDLHLGHQTSTLVATSHYHFVLLLTRMVFPTPIRYPPTVSSGVCNAEPALHSALVGPRWGLGQHWRCVCAVSPSFRRMDTRRFPSEPNERRFVKTPRSAQCCKVLMLLYKLPRLLGY
ncbi:hypothetical protein EDD17DRAFT_1063034, partial [Pisolithus thermaeus]